MRLNAIGLMLTLAFSIFVAPRASDAQPAGKVRRLGLLDFGAAPSAAEIRQSPLWQAMHELGWVEGQNITVERRYAEGHIERLPALATELVHLGVEVIVALKGPAAQAAKQATATIPIVMSSGDPVRAGDVASLAQPGGNMTGISYIQPELAGKKLELLRTLLPTLSRVAFLLYKSPSGSGNQLFIKDAQDAAERLGMQLQLVLSNSVEETESAFAAMSSEGAEALMVQPLFMALGQGQRIADLAMKHRLPTISDADAFAEAGGLLSYGADWRALFRRIAVLTDKILKGAKPADLPVEQPMKFELVINLKTARALGLTIPPTLLFQADEVIR